MACYFMDAEAQQFCPQRATPGERAVELLIPEVNTEEEQGQDENQMEEQAETSPAGSEEEQADTETWTERPIRA